MNVSYKELKLMEEKKKLEEAESISWNGFIGTLGMGFVFVGGCVASMLTIEKTPSWVKYLAIGGAAFTVLFGVLFYYLYDVAKKKKKQLEDKLEALNYLAKVKAKKEKIR